MSPAVRPRAPSTPARAVPALLAGLVLAACSSSTVPSPDAGARSDAGPPLDLFDPDHVLEVEITMQEADWHVMRAQTRDFFSLLVGADCLDAPFESPFTWFEASVTIDGTSLGRIGIRKKGFLGSLSEDKPSLKLDTDRFVDGQRLLGEEHFTFNNALQDPSYVNQCLGYELFRQAGVPAPRCNFAHVTLNGADLGLYVHVEEVRKPFLRAHFGSDDGPLFEGTVSDFRDGWTGTFDPKLDNVDRSGIDALVAVAAEPDDTLLAELDPILDRDAFLTFWATEVLVGHWDGYAGNANNYFVYFDPRDGRARFTPWGADAIFFDRSPLGRSGSAQPALTHGVIAHRLYGLAETRAAYEARSRELMARIWDEAALVAEIDRMQLMLRPYLQARDVERGFDGEVERVRAFVRSREALLGAALDAPYDAPALRAPFCFIPLGDVRGTFETTYGSLGPGSNPFEPPNAGTLELTLAAPLVFAATGGGSGPDANAPDRTVVGAFGYSADGTIHAAVVQIAQTSLRPGNVIDIDFRGAFGFVLRLEPGATEPVVVGLLGGGTVTIDEGRPSPGAPVRGRIEASVFESFL